MKVRIIFRGLVLLRFEQPTGDQLYDGQGCKLRALLIDDPSTEGLHRHVPKMHVIARDGGNELRGRQYPITGRRVSFAFTNSRPDYVVKDPSCEEHVPKLREVYGSAAGGGIDRVLVAAEVIVPAGRIRAKSLVSWTHDFRGPEKNSGVEMPRFVRFLSAPAWGPRLAASECVLEATVSGASLEVREQELASGSGEFSVRRLSPLVPDAHGAHQSAKPDDLERLSYVEPDTVDLLFTNFGPQRSVAVPWSVHFQWLFKVAGYAARNYDTDELDTFTRMAEAFNAREWRHDERHVMGLPIPYLSDLVPEFRGTSPLERELAAIHDPLNRPICPIGMEP